MAKVFYICNSDQQLLNKFNFTLCSAALMGKPEGKRLLGRPRHRWEDNTKMDLQEVGGGGMDWIGLAPDGDRWRVLVNAVMNLQVL
jgi:hypothetical protein